MRFLIYLAVIAAFFWSPGALAFEVDAMSDAEREAFRQEIRAYLLENPEVLMEAMVVLEERQRQAEIAADLVLVHENAAALWNDGISHVGGNPDGDLTIVEFVDYRCGYCRRAHSEVAELLDTDGDIRLITKEYPILGPDSDVSSKAAVATLQLFGPEAYASLYEELITFTGPVNEESLRLLTSRAGLDADPILARMDAPEVAEHIARMHELGSNLRISGTPTFVIGDTMLRDMCRWPTCARSSRLRARWRTERLAAQPGAAGKNALWFLCGKPGTPCRLGPLS